MSSRNTYSNYIQYLKLKNTTTVCAPTAREYDRLYNKALALSTGSDPDKVNALAIVKGLLAIKKNPDVFALFQSLSEAVGDC